MGRRLAVVDCETTGLFRYDRIVEIAVITLDASTLEIVDEYDTLLNPERDTGPVHIHGVTSSMVEAAPSFEEVVGEVARRIDGAVLVAHNLPFDGRMLGQEFARLGGGFDPGRGICTLRATHERLEVACARHGIELEQHHRALTDARATARLLREVLDEPPNGVPATAECVRRSVIPRTLRRETCSGAAPTPLTRLLSTTRYPTSHDSSLIYLDMLNWVLDDRVITAEEQEELRNVVCELGMTVEQVEVAHHNYFRAVVAAAQRDGVITEAEHQLMQSVARALSLSGVHIPAVSQTPKLTQFAPGLRVCFTGSSAIAGQAFTRPELEARAVLAGLQPISGVTKKGCDLLVAADPSSSSGKAKKARNFSIPILSTDAFLRALEGASP